MLTQDSLPVNIQEQPAHLLTVATKHNALLNEKSLTKKKKITHPP